MLDISGLNYWAVVIGWLINIILGSFWYSPIGFGKLWSRLSGIDMMKMSKDVAHKAIMFVAISALLQTLALAIVVHSLHATKLAGGLLIGFTLWFGFTAMNYYWHYPLLSS
jgi:hypothetical protein